MPLQFILFRMLVVMVVVVVVFEAIEMEAAFHCLLLGHHT
jgi:hypothetical protein